MDTQVDLQDFHEDSSESALASMSEHFGSAWLTFLSLFRWVVLTLKHQYARSILTAAPI
jgi:hypothetical protein